ncbi:hypothetical protein [Streptomyces paradoxus]|uniref:Uncharacterized protein n=1 Tax=Streptomyces paradoxus TaxID=66375 RepID=A0A7W9T875_9ACTN|nr:hypothetical protein [Streptomyces paradoxus]MBB6075775.1 hypothetical protein [Streptomyces paradoxus]
MELISAVTGKTGAQVCVYRAAEPPGVALGVLGGIRSAQRYL